MHRSSAILIHSGTFLIVLGAFHLLVWLVNGGDWEGPVSWRKPILFGFSAGVTSWSAAWMVNRLRPWRIDSLLCWAFGISLTLEVLLIAMQRWRGVASHFNERTPIDTIVFSAMGWLILIVTACIAIWTVRGFGQLACPRDERFTLRVGSSFLLGACLFGIFMIIYGQERIQAGMPPEIFGAHGVIKFVHGVPLHTIQWLIVACWIGVYFGLKEPDRFAVVLLVGVGQLWFTAFAAVQVFTGRERFDFAPVSGLLLMSAILFTIGATVPFIQYRRRRRLATS